MANNSPKTKVAGRGLTSDKTRSKIGGSVYGDMNIYGRWAQYAATGHGGNKLLMSRDPRSFHYSMLQRVSPDMVSADVINLESSWKERLHTREPYGLNDN